MDRLLRPRGRRYPRLVGYEVNAPAAAGGETQIVVHEDRGVDETEGLLAEAVAELDERAAAQLWIRGVAPGDDAAAIPLSWSDTVPVEPHQIVLIEYHRASDALLRREAAPGPDR